MTEKDKSNRLNNLLALAIIWLVTAAGDRIWFALDHDIPGWDQAGHLIRALNFRQALENPQWFSGEWWTNFWMCSSKFPPLTYISTVPFLNLFGTGFDYSTLINLLFSAILLASIYGLATQLFTSQVGLWAAGLCLLLPSIYQIRLDFLLDYPLTAIVTLSFWCLTVWKFKEKSQQIPENSSFALRFFPTEFFYSAAFGISFGLALLVKQTALFFLLTPIVWGGIESIVKRAWGRLAQLIGSLLLSVLVCGPWYRTNWLLILTSGKRATIDSALIKGEAPLNTLDAWTAYWKILPTMVSWPLLLVPIVGLLLHWGWQRRRLKSTSSPTNLELAHLKWLVAFFVGAYLLSSLNINKDPRYVAPYLPVLSILLAYGLTKWTSRWGSHIRWGTLSLAGLLMFLNISGLGGALGSSLVQTLSPNGQHYPYTGLEWPHQQVIAEIMKTEPYLRTTLGVLPSTGNINQYSFDYYGALQDFQVFGRQVGVRRKQVPADVRSLSWFLTKSGDQGSVPKEAQAAIVQTVEQDPNFQIQRSWKLPDRNILNLHHRRVPPVQVQPLISRQTKLSTQSPVQLNRVTVPDITPPGMPVPVTYEWSGSWEQLQSGVVLLTWQAESGLGKTGENLKSLRWLHDHGIGMGTLKSSIPIPPSAPFQVIEHTAMLPTADIATGTYTLSCIYLNRETGKTYPISVPPVTLKINPVSPATPAPELDLVTQLRTLATGLPKGRDGLAPVFEEIGRINQYDPIQDYLIPAQQALAYRLQQEPKNQLWAYNLALSEVLQRKVKEAIAALERVTQLDSQNPYAYAYLAFVHLYDWHPKAAQKALKPAFALNTNLPELKALNGIAALMQGNLLQAWHTLQELRIKA